jgi:UDP-2,3-diacylglucosamine hydrolase
LAERYAATSGMTLLPDPTRIDLYGVPTLLMHGDTLCTDDQAYQRFRRRVRRPWLLGLLRCLPLSLRHRMAQQARAHSQNANAGKAPEIMDVNRDEVRRVFQTHAVARLIHGHTHRPAEHIQTIDDRVCTRWVVPDWYQRCGHVMCDAIGCTLHVGNL